MKDLIVADVKKWANLTWLGKWMYNLATQVQVLADIDLGSYYLKNKNNCRGFPYRNHLKNVVNVILNVKLLRDDNGGITPVHTMWKVLESF